ncbi:GAK system ATP-grasp enzyme [Marinomonas sp.]|nr:GAK system ATP-grasp enzyme [Marinomonas sp.]MDB4837702.1 GAK system ATP-grasp enzyme [Marinomonas sp.]
MQNNSTSGLKIGVIGIPGKWSTEVLADRLEARTGFRAVMDMNDIELHLDTNQILCGGVDLTALDGVIVKKISQVYAPSTEDRIHILSQLEAMGVPVFSPTASMSKLINRLSGTLALQQGNIPMPKTRVTESVDLAFNAVREFGSAILKPLYSTKARGMVFLRESDSDESVRAQLEEYKLGQTLFYIQQALNLNGRDLGMVFVGGEYFCTYARVADSDAWNTTIHSGGRYELYEPSAELIELGRRSQACFDMSFTTVDIALTDQGPVVFEVSAFGGFKGALDGCNLDAAEAYSNYVLKTVLEKKAANK